MQILIAILISLAIFILIIGFLLRKKKKTKITQPIPASLKSLLPLHIEFYNNLSPEKQKEFEERVQYFLEKTRITGVGTTVEDLDRILIAASAVIPIFGFPGWEYVNLNEVLLYPDFFNHDFEQKGNDRSVLGMVGNGPMNNVMILSKLELRDSWANKTGKTNTAIHEFVHLVDKTDGTIDGMPEFILHRQYLLPWLQLMQKEIKDILSNNSDINPYGTTNEAEFLAVAAEYFFERPDLLEEKHPELFELLVKIFRQRPGEKAVSY